MEYNTCTLHNGLRIIHLPSASPVVYCGYEVNAGARDEDPEEAGMAHFCEHMTFKGTSRRKAWHILHYLECVGGNLNAYTNKEETVYYATIQKEHIGRAIDLLTDMTFHSTYPQNEIDKEVEVICDEIEIYKDSPADLIYDEFENTIFEGHPLGHYILGEAQQIRHYTTEDALRFVHRYYRPDNAIFFVYGDVDFKKIIRLLKSATIDLCPSPSLTTNVLPVFPPYQPKEVIKDVNTHQTHVMIGNRGYGAHHPQRIALYLLNNILGGSGSTARLNVSLREHHGLVYTVEGIMFNYCDTGVWGIYFGCDSQDIGKCKRLVRKELDKMMEKPLTETQLRAAKKQIKGQIAVACDNRENFALDFGKSFLHYGWKKDIAHLFQQIDAVTADEIQQVAQDLFVPDQLTTLIFK
ncbi:MAG: insulinase family protein [Prevotella sp.]|jgi:predicted Zn-dependent peptidase|nr:insulinase family protein [Prevotella sp.]MCI2080810.1 insulinase family protein [Prevotella sp.]MCI2102713.1 insulinase family protein [Prevotella sp.]HCN52812.1 peptidase M16 [Prevotella sp.]